MAMNRRVFIGAGTALAAVALGRTAPTRAQQAPSTKVLNLYSSRHYDTDNALYQSFTNKTGFQVKLVEAEADQLIERIKSEGASSPADVLITVDAGRLWRAEQQGLFQAVDSSLLKRVVPENLQHPDGLWFGFSKRARVIMYHKDRVNPTQLSTYEALSDPKWRGKILVRSSTNVYNLSLTGSILAATNARETENWARGLVANFARPPEGGDTVQIQAVAAGLGDLAIANTYYLARLMKSDKPEEKAAAEKIGVFFPNQGDRGTHVNISGAGVLKTAPNKAAAVQFLEHLASPEAQEIFALGNSEYPVVQGSRVDPVITSFGDFKDDPLNAAVFGRNNAEALQIMDRAGWT